MEEKEVVSLATPQDKLEEKLINETDVEELKSIINLFNLNVQKKNILRSSKLSDLQDKVYEQMSERLDKKADEFSNQDLLSYFKTIQETISKSDNSLDKIDIPAIQIQQNQLNVNVNAEELNRESRAKILDAIQSIINNDDLIDVDFEEVNSVNEFNEVSETSERDSGSIQREDIQLQIS